MIEEKYHSLTAAELWEKYLAAKAGKELPCKDETIETYGRRLGQTA